MFTRGTIWILTHGRVFIWLLRFKLPFVLNKREVFALRGAAWTAHCAGQATFGGAGDSRPHHRMHHLRAADRHGELRLHREHAADPQLREDRPRLCPSALPQRARADLYSTRRQKTPNKPTKQENHRKPAEQTREQANMNESSLDLLACGRGKGFNNYPLG